ncbi:hypothetical protein [Salinimicrobium sp. GXAS 041]|uniref:hypothetical protein n=1 Tax=Salinimicrobium sp. GXAS 041 TaxID=3400806 RepID=UPI003C710496
MITVTLVDKILISVFIMSYITSMLIQVDNPKIEVRPKDWLLNFLCSSLGVAAAWGWALNWVNLGAKMIIIMIATAVSYPTFKYLNSEQGQTQFGGSIARGLVNMIINGFKGEKVDKTDNQNYIDDEIDTRN